MPPPRVTRRAFSFRPQFEKRKTLALPFVKLSALTAFEHIAGARILIVDDETEHLRSLQRLFEREGASVVTAPSGELALDRLREAPSDVILTDLMMPGISGQALIVGARAIRPNIDVVVMTAYATIENAVEAMRAGAYDFVQKPFKTSVVLRAIERVLERQSLARENIQLRRELRAKDPGNVRGRPIIGRAPAMTATLELVQQAAPSMATVLLMGESGTGKELMARAIHEQSPRFERPFVAVNCAALPESILESELFGHEKGAFTGASQQRAGRVERADGGTLFLDEVAEISPAAQAKLLRVLQEGEFERVGGTDSIQANFRLVAATNRDLEAMVREGRFREDLYYRINVIAITLPALRERREDIPLLASHFLRLYSFRNEKSVEGVAEDALNALLAYDWPGNVRELENVIERAVVLCRSDVVDLESLPPAVRTPPSIEPIARSGQNLIIPIGTRLDDVEMRLIEETLKETRGDKTMAAQLLGIAARTIYRRLKRQQSQSEV